MNIYGEGSYRLVQLLLSKGTALTFLIAFTVALRQYRGLVGENGILPVKSFVKEDSFWHSISLFYIFPSDTVMRFSAFLGISLSALTLLGIPSIISPVFSSVSWFLMWFLFLSFVNTGQKFYEHGWELILLEAGFLMIFAGGVATEMSEILIWLFRWILFRMMLGSGLIKIHGDKAWKDLTALNYHFETQPFPNPLSWYYHHLPDFILKLGVLLTHFMLLIVPFFYFAPQPYAAIAGVLTILYQINIFSSGNYTWLNLTTSVLAVSTFSDEILLRHIPFALELPKLSSYPYETQVFLVAGILGILSLPVLKNMLSRSQMQNRTFDSLHLVNSYGAFEDIERNRNEIILEATDKENPNRNDWHEYIHYEKPGPVEERPTQISPYHHRLDYPFKFADKDPDESHEWIEKLAEKLLEGSKPTEKLFQKIPVEQPENVRASHYKYRFTTPEEKSNNGNWWKRKRIKTLFEKNRS